MSRVEGRGTGTAAAAGATIAATTKLAQAAEPAPDKAAAAKPPADKRLPSETFIWDASPVSTARLAAEMWNVIKNEKWALPVSDRIPWARRLWPVTEHYQMLGGNGAAGVGACAPIAVGAALANYGLKNRPQPNN